MSPTARHELTFLAFCVALPEEGEERLARVDVDDYFSAPATRHAAQYLRGRLHSPMVGLPARDRPLERLVSAIIFQAMELEAQVSVTSAELEIKALQLDLLRLDRHIAKASRFVTALVVERQRVIDAIGAG